jgi:hypothetical protein
MQSKFVTKLILFNKDEHWKRCRLMSRENDRIVSNWCRAVTCDIKRHGFHCSSKQTLIKTMYMHTYISAMFFYRSSNYWQPKCRNPNCRHENAAGIADLTNPKTCYKGIHNCKDFKVWPGNGSSFSFLRLAVQVGALRVVHFPAKLVFRVLKKNKSRHLLCGWTKLENFKIIM